MRRLYSDLFNVVCKECHNYRRKAFHYRRLERLGRPNEAGRSRALPYVFPLNEQNRAVLLRLFGDRRFESLSYPVDIKLSSQHLKTGKLLSVSFRSDGDAVHALEIQSVGTFECQTQSILSFIETVIPILKDLRIRLQ